MANGRPLFAGFANAELLDWLQRERPEVAPEQVDSFRLNFA